MTEKYEGELPAEKAAQQNSDLSRDKAPAKPRTRTVRAKTTERKPRATRQKNLLDELAVEAQSQEKEGAPAAADTTSESSTQTRRTRRSTTSTGTRRARTKSTSKSTAKKNAAAEAKAAPLSSDDSETDQTVMPAPADVATLPKTATAGPEEDNTVVTARLPHSAGDAPADTTAGTHQVSDAAADPWSAEAGLSHDAAAIDAGRRAEDADQNKTPTGFEESGSAGSLEAENADPGVQPELVLDGEDQAGGGDLPSFLTGGTHAAETTAASIQTPSKEPGDDSSSVAGSDDDEVSRDMLPASGGDAAGTLPDTNNPSSAEDGAIHFPEAESFDAAPRRDWSTWTGWQDDDMPPSSWMMDEPLVDDDELDADAAREEWARRVCAHENFEDDLSREREEAFFADDACALLEQEIGLPDDEEGGAHQDDAPAVLSYASDAHEPDKAWDVMQESSADASSEDGADPLDGDAENEDNVKRRRRGRRGGRGHKKGSATVERSETPVTMGLAGSTAYPVAAERNEPDDERMETQAAKNGKRRMYISVLPGEQVEVAITANGILDEYYLDMLHQKKIKGNIYRGVIVNIDINLQAAFVDFGTEKNGFLQIDEIHPEYYISPQEYVRGRKYPPIQQVLRLGQEVLVQVVKEPNGSKGAFLTTWISLAGRFLVLTPGQEQIAISRKVNDEEERSRLRELMNGIDPGDDLGVIVRTVSAGVTQTTLKNDLAYLKRTWNEVRRQATGVSAPACVYREPGLVERAVRDYLTDDVCELWVDNAEVAERIKETVSMLFPHKRDLVRIHNDSRHSLWERFNLRRQLDQIYSREVLMPSGGRLVFDQTEALMAIDINSGKISCKGNFEHMAFKTNMEAAETIARQLKLRDIGGQVVIDFIEMREHKHILEVERTLRNCMKNDRARHDVARMSSFGLLELVRQRTGTSAISISMEPCPACGGTGLRRNLEWQSLQALRDIARLMRGRTSSSCCRYEMTQELGLYLLNHKRDALKELENTYGKSIEIVIRS